METPTATRPATIHTLVPSLTAVEPLAQSTPLATATLPSIISTAIKATPSPKSCPFDYFFTPAPALCANGEPISSFAAEQPFEGGVMVWLETADSIYVFYEDQSWQRFDDDWSEDQRESDPAIVPPEDLFQPIRGFGKVWRDHPEVREKLGWAQGLELAFESKLQEQRVQEGESKVTFLLTFNGQVFALVSREPDQGNWVIAAS